MAKIVSIDEHFQYFLNDLQDSFWGNLTRDLDEASGSFRARLSRTNGPICPGRRESARAPAAGRQSVQMLVAYGVRQDGTATVGPSAHPGREPGPLGGPAQRPLSPRSEGRQVVARGHRWLPRTGGRSPNRLSLRGPSMLLGAQDAQYPGQCAGAAHLPSPPPWVYSRYMRRCR